MDTCISKLYHTLTFSPTHILNAVCSIVFIMANLIKLAVLGYEGKCLIPTLII